MKKTLVALAVAATAATSVNAATLFQGENYEVTISGGTVVRAGLADFDNKDNEPNHHDIWVDDGFVEFGLTAQITEDLKAISGYGIEIEDQDKDNIVAKDIYAGLVFNDVLTVKYGELATYWDDSGIGADIEYGLGIDSNAYADGKNVVKVQYDGENFWVGVAYNAKGQEHEKAHADLGAGLTLGDLALSLYYAAEVEGVYEAAYDFNATYTLGNTEFGVGYATQDKAGEALGLYATHSIDKVTLGVGVDFAEAELTKNETTVAYVNATYALHSNVSIYTEFATQDNESLVDEKGIAYLVGMDFSF